MDTTAKALVIPEVEELEFFEKTHTYRLDGFEIPSVSEIMKPLSDARYSNVDERTLNKAADKGTAVHNAIENWIKFDIEDVPEIFVGYFEAFKKWWGESQPEVVGSEIRVCHKVMRYAGTVDLVAYIGGRLTLVDYKSTAVISDMTCGVQLEAYSRALEDMGVKVERKLILHLKSNGKYTVHEYPERDNARWNVFASLKIVHDYIEMNGKT